MLLENGQIEIASEANTRFLPAIPTELIGGVPVAAMTRQETARVMINIALQASGLRSLPLIFSSMNGQVLSTVGRARNLMETMRILGDPDVISADGQPLVFASRILGKGGIRERCATTDLFHDVAEIAVNTGVTFYMLGASPEENKEAVRNVRRDYPGLRLVGYRHGYFASMADEEAAVEEINSLDPDIVWVAMGFPYELDFCVRWRHRLTNVAILKTSGGLFNFLSGTRSRAPIWMQTAGLEWAYRLALEPRRLFLRYTLTNVHATWLLLTRTNS
jgi:N-acetylglucosaminyldiphosphoundecaprenol N-acetyl-beta-D-mannosaminyltransferase